ncbi:MAG TPA: 2-oxoglutarate dehydrogenase E1 component [Alphaproteobacteria bacterium]|nr:2-oxoglutarate dehydrogenase E1 component [Alphaproteobacteria bacterium]
MTAPVFDSSSLPFVEEKLAQWQANPASVDREWQAYFSGWMAAQNTTGSGTGGGNEKSLAAWGLIDAWRKQGFESANLNPLNPAPARSPELDPASYKLNPADVIPTFGVLPKPEAPVADVMAALQRAYGGSTGIETGAVQNTDARAWVQQWWEKAPEQIAEATQKRLYEGLVKANAFERYLHTKFVGAKRFSLEGNDAFIPMFISLIERYGAEGGPNDKRNILLGMAHRGRLNVLCNVFHKPYAELMAGFADTLNDAEGPSAGDVKYHLGKKYAYHAEGGATVNLTIPFNPSHLEAVNAVVAGGAKALIDAGQTALPVLVHGDAAVAGQGSVAELYNFAAVGGYNVGGTIHVVLNNQIGFTAEPRESTSGAWCTDNFRATGGPIVHVNADDAEACHRAIMFAFDYRQQFGADVMLDVIGYRRWGHNEGDDPTFTQPLLYEKIRSHPVPADVYKARLNMPDAEAERVQMAFINELNAAYAASQTGLKTTVENSPRLQPDAKAPATAIKADVLKKIAAAWKDLPAGFVPNEKVAKVIDERIAMLNGERDLNWGAAETAAYGALLTEGIGTRISGQDAQRGTFSHRHGVLIGQTDAQRVTPLNTLAKNANLSIYNSPLSEYVAMGFEYGYALEQPETLTIWEGQFGDFANGAQIIIDQFLAAAGAKWGQANGLTLLLPHGYEGQGPEHSSARIERFLQLCAENNLAVATPSTPAQIFHLLRRQAKQRQRVPLVVFTPKSLLRHPAAVSPATAITTGGWQPVIVPQVAKAKRVILCSGKIYYDLTAKIAEAKIEDTAVLRLEQLYPFPVTELAEALTPLKTKTVVWAQEEPRNMGAWQFVRDNWNNDWGFLHYAGRPASASPATGTLKRHQTEQAKVIAAALGIE